MCSEINAASLIIIGANHGLVVHQDVRATVAGFAALAEATLQFASELRLGRV